MNLGRNWASARFSIVTDAQGDHPTNHPEKTTVYTKIGMGVGVLVITRFFLFPRFLLLLSFVFC